MGHKDTFNVLLDALDRSRPGNLAFHERFKPPAHLYAAHAQFMSVSVRTLRRIAQAQARSRSVNDGEGAIDVPRRETRRATRSTRRCSTGPPPWAIWRPPRRSCP